MKDSESPIGPFLKMDVEKFILKNAAFPFSFAEQIMIRRPTSVAQLQLVVTQ